MSTAGVALYAALWPYVADLTTPGPRRPRVEDATYEQVAAIYGTGRAARSKMADALGLTTGPEGSPERRARQSFLEAARRWERGAANPSKDRGSWAKLVRAAGQEVGRRNQASRRVKLDTLVSMIAARGLLIKKLSGQMRISNDDRRRDIDVTGHGAELDDDDEEPSALAQGIWLDPDDLEDARYGAGGQNVYDALTADDWDTAALCVFSLFVEVYTEGATGGYPTVVDDVEDLEIEIP